MTMIYHITFLWSKNDFMLVLHSNYRYTTHCTVSEMLNC